MNLLNDVLIIIIAERSRQFVVVHIVFILPEPPQFGHFFSVDELELSFIVGPSDDSLVLLFINEKLKQELPQSDV